MKKITSQIFFHLSIALGLVLITFVIFIVYLLRVEHGLLTIEQKQKVILDSPKTVLDAQKPILITINPKQNNLGMIILELPKNGDPVRVNKGDLVEFKIKDQTAANWYFISKHPLVNFFGITSYSFPFNPIANSKDKVYLIQLSVQSPINTSITLHPNTTVTLKYLFNKTKVNENIGVFNFLVSKIRLSVTSLPFLADLFSFSLPFISYMIYIFTLVSPYRKKIDEIVLHNKITFNYAAFTALSCIYFNLPFNHLGIIFLLTILLIWIVGILWRPLSSNSTFVTALGLLLTIPVYLLLQDTQQAEQVANWVYTFLIIATIQRLLIDNLNKV